MVCYSANFAKRSPLILGLLSNIGFKYMTMNQVSGAIISKLWFYNALFCLVRTEFSTWVNLSLYVIAVLRSNLTRI
ncbi:hypothetical protein [Lactococcus cremoris]|uniref:hypothetical protein n=1 Tax=Lactococcus lactis subsp. cremoris TaxID=1359 RepID=UPI002FCC6BF8